METFCIITDSWNSKNYRISKIEYSIFGEIEYCYDGKDYYEKNFSNENIIVISYDILNFEEFVDCFLEKIEETGFVYTNSGLNTNIYVIRKVLQEMFKERHFFITL